MNNARDESSQVPPIDPAALQQFLDKTAPEGIAQLHLANHALSPSEPRASPFPARTQSTTITIADIPTVVTVSTFSDRMMVTISQNGKLSHWIHTPLSITQPSLDPLLSTSSNPLHTEDPLLPLPEVQASTLFGSRGTVLETWAQLLARQIGSAMVMKAASEGTDVQVGALALGVGFEKHLFAEEIADESKRDLFMGALEGVLRCV